MFTEKSLADRLKAFDVYKKIPKHYLESSFLGGICK